MLKLRTLAIAVAVLFVFPVVVASADAPPGPYFNGFETDTAGWVNYFGATVTRVPSGSPGTYASGTPAATGNYYARLGIGNNATCESGAGTQDWFVGPYTKWGGYSAIFPLGGYTTGVDVYLDVPYAMTHADKRFDWSSSISDTTGGFRRDFVFNVATDALGFVINGTNNANRCGANPHLGGTSVHVMQSGWYTFKHTFSGVNGGPLTVTMQLIQKMTGITVGTWARSDPSDIIGTTVGGNHYGWFVQNEVNDLPIDNSFRTGVVSTPNCTIKISNGGWFTATNGDTASFGGNASVSAGGNPSGQEEYQDHGPMQPINAKAISVTAILCSDDRTQASIFGYATVNGSGSYQYEIDLKDAGEPGTNDTYAIQIPEAAYTSGPPHTLQGGNIQIR